MSLQHANSQPVWTESSIRELFEHSADVQIQLFHLGDADDTQILFIYAEGLCDSSQISKVVLPELHDLAQGQRRFREGYYGTLPLIPLHSNISPGHLVEFVFQGDLILFFPNSRNVFKMNACNPPGRTPEESTTEISIKGPKDGFVEDIATNVALVRKRIRSNSLSYEMYILGTRTRTKVGLMYIEDILSPQILQEVRKRIKKIDIDGIYSIAQLEENLSDVKYSLFPLIDFTGRPDYAVSALLAGRFVLIVDGNPFVLIGPATLSLILKSPEDIHFGFQYVSFARLIRLFSLWLSILLPGFWVAIVAFHQDQIPFRLMATISVARMGLPFSSQMEMLILLLLLEIFREAGVRLPSSIGQILTVVGGLVIGDAAIRSGLVSPSVVVVGAITAVSGATLVNQSLSTVISIVRLVIFLLSAFLGMYGMILSLILLLFYMSKLQSFGVPYLAPLSPVSFKDLAISFLKIPYNKMKKRPSNLSTLDSDHQGDSTT
ncbi:spore germination protein [Paenibacillus sp. H1-7]|uniref:spore germination protein n=1 Tax=Paenibacillus sp. H1-7 TaxID=2282849 RepID=UPI001EF7BF9D|nr:spore germination protein [Paenibacillus sp. H1-7]ULL16220.1 spore germination protein [Paenibacillus sp. H1-7]